jgi:hypothetical protein
MKRLKMLEMVCIAPDGFTKSWDVFVHGVVARENLPNWQRGYEMIFCRKRLELTKKDHHLQLM